MREVRPHSSIWRRPGPRSDAARRPASTRPSRYSRYRPASGPTAALCSAISRAARKFPIRVKKILNPAQHPDPARIVASFSAKARPAMMAFRTSSPFPWGEHRGDCERFLRSSSRAVPRSASGSTAMACSAHRKHSPSNESFRKSGAAAAIIAIPTGVCPWPEEAPFQAPRGYCRDAWRARALRLTNRRTTGVGIHQPADEVAGVTGGNDVRLNRLVQLAKAYARVVSRRR